MLRRGRKAASARAESWFHLSIISRKCVDKSVGLVRAANFNFLSICMWKRLFSQGGTRAFVMIIYLYYTRPRKPPQGLCNMRGRTEEVDGTQEAEGHPWGRLTLTHPLPSHTGTRGVPPCCKTRAPAHQVTPRWWCSPIALHGQKQGQAPPLPHSTICFLPSSRLSPQGPPSAPTTATPQHPFHIHAQERQLLQLPCTNAQGRKAAQSEFSSRAPAGKHAESAAEQPCSLLAPSERRSQETGLLALLWCDCCWEHLPVEVPANTSLICAASRSQHHTHSIAPQQAGWMLINWWQCWWGAAQGGFVQPLGEGDAAHCLCSSTISRQLWKPSCKMNETPGKQGPVKRPGNSGQHCLQMSSEEVQNSSLWLSVCRKSPHFPLFHKGNQNTRVQT